MAVSRPIDTANFLMPWEHYVCSVCFQDNPYAVWLIKQYCLKPGLHRNESQTLVVISESSAVLEEIRPLPQHYNHFRGSFVKCYYHPSCRYEEKCRFAHSDAEEHTWNTKKQILQTSPHMAAEAAAVSCVQCRSPSEVCRACFADHHRAVWLASLLCVHPEEHQSKERIKVVVDQSKLHVVRVSEPPIQHIPHQGGYCGQCFCTHSPEELQYWGFQRLNKSLSQVTHEFQALCDRYQYPTEEIAKQRVEQMTLTQENYRDKYHLLVYLDEMEHSRKMIQECDGQVVVHIDANEMVPLKVEGMTAASVDYAVHGHAVMEFAVSGYGKIVAHTVEGDDRTGTSILLADMSDSLVHRFHQRGPISRNVSAHFEINHKYFKQQHQAISNIHPDAISKLLPSLHTMTSTGSREAADGVITSCRLPLDSEYQLPALKRVLNTQSEVPHLVLGPFGTGKTRLVAATVLKLLSEDQNSRILVCTHLNKGANSIYAKLQEVEKKTRSLALRLIPPKSTHNLYNANVRSHGDDDLLPCLLQVRVVVTTFLTALNLERFEDVLHFTHILIDEGAQSRESEALGALVMAERDTKVIIVGDNKQVGPQVLVLSKAARDNGFGMSLIERLFLYYKSHRVDKKFASTLLTNYRSHPSILMLASALLYECRLLSRSDSEAHPLAPYPIMFACSSLEQRGFSNRPAVDEKEAKILVKQVMEFIKSWPTSVSSRQRADKPVIGLLATNWHQLSCLRTLFRSIQRHRQLPCHVEYLPTYKIQGEEFSAIFLSTCEATDEDGNPRDPVRSICNEQIFNTLVTRARSLIFVAGNPFLLQHMGKDYPVNCWEEYIRRCFRCQTLQLPEIKSEEEEQTLPAIMDQLHQLACSQETLGQATKAIDLQDNEVDEILDRYTSDLLKRNEFKMAHQLVQDHKGRMAWEPDTEKKDTKKVVWCRLEMNAHYSATAFPTNSSSSQAPIKLDSQRARRLAFHGDVVQIDTIRKCVLLDSRTEKAVNETHFGIPYLCRVDSKNPIVFSPFDKRHPKFVNLPTLSKKESKERMGVVCFDPKSVRSKTIPMMNDFIPLECASKMLFIVRFLGWKERFRFPLGIIVAALPAGYSVSTGDQILRIANSIPLTPVLLPEPFHQTPLIKDGRPHYNRAITIDPQGSRDHDDALTCVCTAKNGDLETFEFGVHITSLNDYISKDSELDRLARERGCSVYQSSDRCISHMLPTALMEITSLLPGETRAAFSVVGEVRIKAGNIQRLQLKRITESHVTSALELTYSDAQTLLDESQSISQDLQEKVLRYESSGGLSINKSLTILWMIAFHLRKVRLGEAAFCFYMDDPDCEHHPEAHFLVEQFMIWANETIAERLLQYHYSLILRAQGPPDKERLQSLVEKQGPNMALSLALRKYNATQDKPSDSIHILQDILIQLHQALRNGNIKEAFHIIQFEHLHPQTVVPHHLFKRVQSRSNYCVSGENISYKHETLQCKNYTHFTSPIRRYIDLVIHRILYAALKGEPAPYEEKELKEICYECQKANRQEVDYERDMKSVILASELIQSSKKYTIFMTKVEEGKLHFCFRDIALKWYQSSIPLRCLNAKGASGTKKAEASPQSTLYEWNVKMTSMRGNTKSFLANDSLQFCETLEESHTARVQVSMFVPEGEDKDLRETKVMARVKPVTCSIPSRAWIEAQACLKESMNDVKVCTVLQKMQPTDKAHSPNRIDVPVCQSPLWSCKLQVPVQPCEVMQVQLSAERKDSMLKPAIQLLEVGPGVQVCIQHNMNPAECFTDKLTTNASQKRYNNPKDYFLKWEKVVLAEAAFNSLSDSQFLIIKDVILKWPKLQKCVASLDGQIYYQLPQPEGKDSGVELTLPKSFVLSSYDFFEFMEGDLVCVRYNIATTNGRTQNTVFHMVVHHADKVKEEPKDIKVFLKFIGNTSNYISCSMEKFLRNSTQYCCELQLIPLSLPYRRVYHSLHQLKVGKRSDLARQIALGDAEIKHCSGEISKYLQQSQVTMATSLWPLKKKRNGKRMTLNAYQREAINIACSNEFCMIQGPPGTGKSVTGAHMAYALAMKLKKELASQSRGPKPEEVPCVMYVGPSQHSVNVVLDMLVTQMPENVRRELKILRVFSKGIERKEFPGPLENKEAFHHVQTDVDCKPHHRAVALHHLIREKNPNIKAMEEKFHKLHREGKIASSNLRHKYNTAIGKAEQEVFKKDVDIVLCTCNEASSHRITRSVIPVYCIVDECAMATEPECMIPIRRAEHVVLIGDHQQLQPVINYKPAGENGLGRSLFERYVNSLKAEPHMLRVQYRMHRALCEFPNNEFYDGKLQTDERVRMERERQAAELRRFWPQGNLKPFVFCNVIGEEEEVPSGWKGMTKVGSESKFNGKEARKIVQIMKFLRDRCEFDIGKVTALTPYSAQKDEIKKEMKRKSISGPLVKTITESQGSEFDIVLLSMVRSKKHQEILTRNGEKKPADFGWRRANLGFITDRHQICVAITRCKYGLVIVGNKALLDYDSTWSNLIAHYQRHNCITEEGEFPIY